MPCSPWRTLMTDTVFYFLALFLSILELYSFAHIFYFLSLLDCGLPLHLLDVSLFPAVFLSHA